MTSTIKNPDAPMYNGATLEQLQFIKNKLGHASFHYADDTAGEWGKARTCVNEAAQEINRLRISVNGIRMLCKDELVTLDQVLEAVIVYARRDR